MKPAVLTWGLGCWYRHCGAIRQIVHYPLPDTAEEKRA